VGGICIISLPLTGSRVYSASVFFLTATAFRRVQWCS